MRLGSSSFPAGTHIARTALVAGSSLLLSACARQGPPPGGPEDVRPPVVVSTVPESFANLADFSGPVVFAFDERISERVTGGELDGAVIVSPRTGRVRVNHGRRELEVELDGGFRADFVYRVTLLPVVSDLFNNVMRDPFEIVFSTGPEPAPTVVAGLVWDRISGRPVQAVDIFATPSGGGDPFVARADANGLYALRYVPPGDYTLTAFRDVNRNGEIDRSEPRGEGDLELASGDTIFFNPSLLAPDTTPSVPTAATPLDSVTILLEFDDYMDAEGAQAAVGVEVMRVVDSIALAVDSVFTELEYSVWAASVADSLAVADSVRTREEFVADSVRAREEFVADSIRAQAAPPDTAGIAPAADTTEAGPTVTSDTAGVAEVADSAEADPEAEEQGAEEAAADAEETPPQPPIGINGRPAARSPPSAPLGLGGPGGERLPTRIMVVTLLEPLEPGTIYSLEVAGVVNINGVAGGGGLVSFETEPAEEPGELRSEWAGPVLRQRAPGVLRATTGVRPRPTTWERPQPTTWGRPQPTTWGRPQPTTWGRPRPTAQAHPRPTIWAHPQPTAWVRRRPAK